MITIVGINHTEKLENKLLKIISDFNPNALCVELDEFGFKNLKKELSQKEIMSYFSSMPSTFKLLSLYKSKSQKDRSVDRTWDSNFALKLSKNLEFKIIPIDIDKKTLYTELDSEISFLEKFRILRGVIKKLFFSKNNSVMPKDYETKFPTLKKYLIDKRSEYMADEIIKNASLYKDILVLVGNNHLEDFKKLIVLDDLRIITLDEFKNI